MVLLAICFSLIFACYFCWCVCSMLCYILCIAWQLLIGFFEHQEFGSPCCWTENLHSKLSVSSAKLPIRICSRAVPQELIDFSRCSVAEARAIPGFFKNVTKWSFAAFLLRSGIPPFRKIGSKCQEQEYGSVGHVWATTEKRLVGVCYLRCCIPNHSPSP